MTEGAPGHGPGRLPFELRNAEGERLDHAYRQVGAAAAPPQTLVVVGHGVTSHWDRPWQTGLAEALAAAGLPTVLLSFAGNGDSEGRFEDVTPSKEAADLGAVIDALERWGVRRIVYAGHSMGAAVGVLRAAGDPRLSHLVSLAGMFHVDAFMRRTFGHLVPGQGLMLDKPGCIWNNTLADDAARLGSLHTQAAAVTVPWLLVHGDADELVPLQDSLDAHAAAAGRPELVVLRGVDHRFTGAIPEMTSVVVGWLTRLSVTP